MAPAMSRVGVAALLFGSVEVQALRTTKRGGDTQIAGVPVFNYDKAYTGRLASQGSQEENWMVVLKEGVQDADIDIMCSRAKKGCSMVGHPSSGGVPFLQVQGTEEDLEAVLKNAEDVAEFIEPELLVDPISETEEMEASPTTSLWGLNRVGVPDRATTGKGVTVYVFDTGVRTTHNDFGGRAATGLDMISGTPIECNGDVECAKDNVGHGTHCAGTAAGTTYGVASDAMVRSVKVLSQYPLNPWSWSIGGLDWLASKGQRPGVASMSLGAPPGQDTTALERAVNVVVNAGFTVVVSAGNNNADACRQMPAMFPSVISVGSTGTSNQKSRISNFGECVHIWAPGENILSADWKTDTGSYTLTGTSMACPHVSGGAALLLENNPGWSPSRVRSELMSNTLDNIITGISWPDTNKLLFVGAGARPPTPAPAPTPAPTTTQFVPSCSSNASGPDSDGDCRCRSGTICHEGNSRGCPFSNPRLKSDIFHSVTCTNCECRSR